MWALRRQTSRSAFYGPYVTRRLMVVVERMKLRPKLQPLRGRWTDYKYLITPVLIAIKQAMAAQVRRIKYPSYLLWGRQLNLPHTRLGGTI